MIPAMRFWLLATAILAGCSGPPNSEADDEPRQTGPIGSQTTAQRIRAQETLTPYDDVVRFPDDWPEKTRTRQAP